jgi:hypothetical protein
MPCRSHTSKQTSVIQLTSKLRLFVTCATHFPFAGIPCVQHMRRTGLFLLLVKMQMPNWFETMSFPGSQTARSYQFGLLSYMLLKESFKRSLTIRTTDD